MLNLSAGVFIYSQNLDNKGGTQYWKIDKYNSCIENISSNDTRLNKVREHIDNVNQEGRVWRLNEYGVDYKLKLSGECLITIKPVTLDNSGRVSPVLVVCDILCLDKYYIDKIINIIEFEFGRELNKSNLEGLKKLKRYLSWPKWFLFLNILLFSWKSE